MLHVEFCCIPVSLNSNMIMRLTSCINFHILHIKVFNPILKVAG